MYDFPAVSLHTRRWMIDRFCGAIVPAAHWIHQSFSGASGSRSMTYCSTPASGLFSDDAISGSIFYILYYYIILQCPLIIFHLYDLKLLFRVLHKSLIQLCVWLPDWYTVTKESRGHYQPMRRGCLPHQATCLCFHFTTVWDLPRKSVIYINLSWHTSNHGILT